MLESAKRALEEFDASIDPQLGTTATLRGTVLKIYFNSPNWCAVKLRLDTDDATRTKLASVAGKFYVSAIGDRLTVEGKWTYDKKYGKQLTVDKQILESVQMSVEGLASWLAVAGEMKGIGPVKAERIAKAFGERFSEVLRNNPQEIADVANVDVSVVESLQSRWFREEDLNLLGTRLMGAGLTKHQVEVLYDRFSGNALKILEDNPYAIVGEIEGLGFKTCDEIAQKMGAPLDHPGRLSAAINYALWDEVKNGSSCVPLGELSSATAKLLNFPTGEPRIGLSIKGLVDERKIVECVIDENGYYAVPAYYKYEKKLADFLNSASDRQGRQWMFKEGEEIIDDAAKWLDDSQQHAVKMALTNRVSLISGGAGAGKTSLIKEIVRLCRKKGLRVNLCAPTGKAARRIETVVDYPAATIHRMLRYHPLFGFSDEKLDCDIVICDETSMVDSALAFHLVRVLNPYTHLVLVGDHHQLPPVGAGSLLRDCIKNELLPMVVLEHCHRQAGTLKQNCSAILDGEMRSSSRGEKGDWPWIVRSDLADHEKLRDYLKMLFSSGIRDKLGFDPLKEAQFITPQHAGPIGTVELNKMFQAVRQSELGVTVDKVEDGKKGKLMVGDKAIQTKNDYQLDVMNGHQGIVTGIDPLVVDFGDGKVVAYPKEKQYRVELGYCLSCHRCQGDQWPVVVSVFHRSHWFMLHRGLLYTAATRAMKHAIVLGEETGIKRAVSNVQTNDRKTLLPFLAREGRVA